MYFNQVFKMLVCSNVCSKCTGMVPSVQHSICFFLEIISFLFQHVGFAAKIYIYIYINLQSLPIVQDTDVLRLKRCFETWNSYEVLDCKH